MKAQKQERKDWVLLIFIIPIGVLILLFVGQWAIRVLPFWSVNAGMNSNLEPDSGAAHPFALLEPLLPQILVPLPWAETYLDPGNGEISFPPFLTFEPTATPSPTVATPSPTETTPTAIVTETPTPTATFVTGTPAPTSTPPVDETEPPDDGSPTPPTTCQDPLANNQGQPLPCTYSPTTCTDPLANNQGQPLPCTYPPTTCTDPLANNQGQPLPCTYSPICPGAHNPYGPPPCDYGSVATIAPGLITATPPPELNVGGPPDNTDPNDDSNVSSIQDGSYIVVSLQIQVGSTPDNNYDLAFYEWNNDGAVFLDLIIIGISNFSDGSQYYEVFNWGNGIPDTNSNVGDVAVANGGEIGDQEIAVAGNNEVPPSETVLYDPDYDSVYGTNGPLPQTGILIDVDNADSNPPPGTYQFVVIISPPSLPGGDGGSAQVDAVQAVEVPIPTP